MPVFAAVLAAATFFGLSNQDFETRQALPLVEQFDRLAEYAGFGLNHVTVNGHKMTSDRDIFAVLDLASNRSLLKLDSAVARERLEQLPWVKSARIKRSIPHRVDIEIIERQPFAVWRSEKHDVLIDRTGRRLAVVRQGSIAHLPRITGSNGEKFAGKIVMAARQWPELADGIATFEFVGGRRWNFNLHDGRVIQLPEVAAGAAIQQLMQGSSGARLFDRTAVDIDLRVAGQITFRPVGSARTETLLQSRITGQRRPTRNRDRG
ncbi:MAG: cell division protein FtsQ/DivIB [Hyphomicrobiaceae bacterium]